jgi:nicotinamide-nucleotide amidase
MIGDELLSGDVVDENKAWLGRRCRALGVEVIQASTVRDRELEIVAAMREAAKGVDLCLVSGGLGPTTDDLTAACAALAAGVELVRRPELAERLEAFFAARGRALVEANLKQADLPAGAVVLDNPIGTAAGFGLELGRCWLFSMPGVPRELRKMMREQVEPRVRERFSLAQIPRRIYRAIGSGESSVQHNVQGVLAQARERSPGLANMFVHYRARYPEVQLILEATPGSEPDQPGASVQELASLDEPLRAAIGPALYTISDGDDEDESLAKLLVTRLIERGLTLVSAESCTGGGIGEAMTSVAGSSACFLGGVIAYSNEVKMAQLGVSPEDLRDHGAVSEPVARAMAEGARTRLNAAIGVSTTGIAGPGGGSETKPVGTVDVAVATAIGTTYKRLRLLGTRGMIRHAATLWALKLVLDQLDTLSSSDNVAPPS